MKWGVAVLTIATGAFVAIACIALYLPIFKLGEVT
jgi:type II secretory pathway component PulF